MMNHLHKADLRAIDPGRVDLRRIGRQLGLLLALAVVVFLYLMVLTRGGILR
ncbi:hypothetical protein [Streptomyces sp. NRRL S-646]|uniref:hypothetical protein n=1 Tax=Streptomyces sp. NRRL S-646 TaxID=1463917 RepID=UPI000A8966CA|nr:hypothetical protein [Streptomyces sp. NRRL S-646]